MTFPLCRSRLVSGRWVFYFFICFFVVSALIAVFFPFFQVTSDLVVPNWKYLSWPTFCGNRMVRFVFVSITMLVLIANHAFCLFQVMIYILSVMGSLESSLNSFPPPFLISWIVHFPEISPPPRPRLAIIWLCFLDNNFPWPWPRICFIFPLSSSSGNLLFGSRNKSVVAGRLVFEKHPLKFPLLSSVSLKPWKHRWLKIVPRWKATVRLHYYILTLSEVNCSLFIRYFLFGWNSPFVEVFDHTFYCVVFVALM